MPTIQQKLVRERVPWSGMGKDWLYDFAASWGAWARCGGMGFDGSAETSNVRPCSEAGAGKETGFQHRVV